MSISARHSAATTLLRVPPWITPGLTVMPRSEPREAGDFFDLPRHFDNRVRAVREIDSRVRGAAADRDGVIADAFARGLQFPFEPGARLEHQHRGAVRAASSVSAREDSLPTSSSEFTCNTTLRVTGTPDRAARASRK